MMGFVCKGHGASVVRRKEGWLHSQSWNCFENLVPREAGKLCQTSEAQTSALSAVAPPLSLAMQSCFIKATSKYRLIVLVREWRAHLSKN